MSEQNRVIRLAVNDLKKIAEVLRKNEEIQLAELVEEYINLPPPSNSCESKVDELNRYIRSTTTVADLMQLLLELFGNF